MKGTITHSGASWRTERGGLLDIPESRLEDLHRAGYNTYELPEKVAGMVAEKAAELDISPLGLMEIIAAHRSAEDKLGMADILRGFQLAENRVTNR